MKLYFVNGSYDFIRIQSSNHNINFESAVEKFNII